MSKVSLEKALELFILDCESRRLSENTIESYQMKLGYFIKWCKNRQVNDIQDVEAIHIRGFLADMGKRDLADSYQYYSAAFIRAWLNYCLRDELITVNPFAKVKMPKKSKKILPAFTEDELKDILRVCATKRDEAIVLTLLDSGVRASELCALNVGDVNFKNGRVMVKAGKGEKDRIVYISATTRKAVVRYLAERGEPSAKEPLFITTRQARMTLSGIVQLMDRLQQKTGIEHLSAHTFRRTFALRSARSGMNVHVLAQLMGHADIQMLRKYLDIKEEDLKAAADQHGVVEHFFM